MLVLEQSEVLEGCLGAEGGDEMAHTIVGGTIGSQSTARENRLEEVGLRSVVETSDLDHSLVGSRIVSQSATGKRSPPWWHRSPPWWH